MKDVEDTGTVNATICPVGPATADKEGDPESSVPPPNQESPAVATAGSTKLEDDDDDKYEEGVPKSGDNGGAPTGTNTPAEEDNGSFCSEDSSTCSDDDNDDDDTDSDVEAAAAAAATTTTGGGLYLSLTERRALNVQRNDNEMIRLGVAHGIRRRPSATERGGGAGDGDPSTPQRQRKSRKNRANPSIASPRGMLLFHQNKATAALNNDHAKNWNEIYPHRESLIRKLRAWVSVPIAMATTTPTTTNSGASSSNEKLLPFVPPPIFVSGPCGCGKTAIVRDVVQCATALANNTSNNDHRADASQSNNPTSPWGGSGSSSTMAGEVVAAHAYIDCVALDVRSVEEFVNDVHGQFARQIIRRRRTSNDNNSSSKRGGGVGGVSNARSPHQPSPPTTMRKRKSLSHRCDDPSDYGLQQQDQDRDIPNGGNDSISSAKRGPVSTVDHAAVPVTRRRASERNRHASSSNRSAILPPHAARVSRTNRGTASKGGPATPNPAGSTNNTAADASNSNSSALSTTPLIAAWNLGKLLQRLVAPPSRGSASGPHTSTTTVALFLVVDQADRLFSLGSSSSMYKSAADRINFLAQLLLLPRTLGLNLTIICISNSILLEHTAVNNVSALGTIADHIHPLRIHFPAYRPKLAIHTILKTERMKRLIVGDTFCAASAFFGTVYESFLKTLVQFLYDLTLDMKEYLRLGRSLWPQYIVPVLPANVDATMKAVTSKASNKLQKTKSWIEREILSLLDQRIFPRIKRAMEHGLGLLALNSPFPIETSAAVDEKETRHSSQDMPQLAIYLFLAVYLCQANRPDRDKHLFSIQTNGKTKKGVNGSMEEDVAFGLGPQAASLRSRSFPAERLYSLYVSIISLHPFNDLAIENCNSPNKTLHSLGNVTFHEMVAYLKDVGVLHEYPKRSISDTIRVGQRSFWSSITFDEAQRAANTINFPLDRYTM